MKYHPLILEYNHVINGLLPLFVDLATNGGPKLLEYFYNHLGLYDQSWAAKAKGYDKNAVVIKDFKGSNYKFDASIDMDNIR